MLAATEIGILVRKREIGEQELRPGEPGHRESPGKRFEAAAAWATASKFEAVKRYR